MNNDQITFSIHGVIFLFAGLLTERASPLSTIMFTRGSCHDIDWKRTKKENRGPMLQRPFVSVRCGNAASTASGAE